MAADRPRNAVEAQLGAIRDQLGELQDQLETHAIQATNSDLIADLMRVIGSIEVVRDAATSAWSTAYAFLPDGYMQHRERAAH